MSGAAHLFGSKTHGAVTVVHPLFGAAPIKASIWQRPDDDELATAQTIALMKLFALEDARSPIVRRAAQEAIGLLPLRNAMAEAAAVWVWIRRHVRLVSDVDLARLAGCPEPEEAEVLIRPVDLLRMPQPQGDCDCQAMLGAAMLRALGIDSEFATIAADPADPTTYSHVYVLVKLPCGRELPLDFSHAPGPGWTAISLGKARVWHSQRVGLAGIGRRFLGAIDWGSLLQSGVSSFERIAEARWGQPPVGTYIQTGAAGEKILYRQPPTASALQFPGITAGGSWLSLAAILVVVVILIGLLRGRS